MRPLLDGPFANPSALHAGGREARAIIERARRRWPACSAAPPTRSSSRAAAARRTTSRSPGAFFALRDRGDHIVTTTVEHPAILEPARFLERLGARVTLVPVDGYGPGRSRRRPPGDHAADRSS